MATYTYTMGATDPQGAIAATLTVNLKRNQEGFCSVCPSGDHPEVPECEWLVAESPPDLGGERLSSDVSLTVTGAGSWWVRYEHAGGVLVEDTIAAVDGVVTIPTGGQSLRTPHSIVGASYERAT